MARFLKQSTTVSVRLGPALDATDGVTEEVGLSPIVEISKGDGAFAARNSATAITHDSNGWYVVEFNTTDTNTLGNFVAKFDDSATHLPVWHEFAVVTANVFDTLYSTDILDVNVSTMSANSLTASAVAADAVAEIADGVLDEAIAEPASVFAWPGTLRTIVGWLGALSRNKVTQTATTQLVRNDADSATIGTSTVSDDTTTFTRGEFS